MNIFCIIPVHNRIHMTQKVVSDLFSQDFTGRISIVMVDDGSTDGTGEFLRSLAVKSFGDARNLRVISGNGQWWWSHCVNEAIKLILESVRPEDGVIFLNDDVHLEPSYIANLVDIQMTFGTVVVMSQLVDISDHSNEIISSIALANRTLSIIAKDSRQLGTELWSTSELAPGRGTLYPASLFIRGFRIDEKNLPHYLADYEFSCRVKREGVPIIVAHNARVFTDIQWGNARRKKSLWWRLTATESPDFLRAYWKFWRVAAPDLSRGLLVIRLFRFRLAPALIERLFGRERKLS